MKHKFLRTEFTLLILPLLAVMGFGFWHWRLEQVPQELIFDANLWDFATAVASQGDSLVVTGGFHDWKSGQSVAGGWQGTHWAEMRNASSGTVRVPLAAPASHVSRVLSPVFSPDGVKVAAFYANQNPASGSSLATESEKYLACWDVYTGKLIWKSDYAFAWEELSGRALAFSQDGKWLLADGDRVRIFDAHNGKFIRTLAQANYHYASAFISPDGRYIATSGEKDGTQKSKYDTDTTTRIRNLNGDLIRTLPETNAYKAFWSQDGSLLAQLNRKGVHLWSADGKNRLWTVPASRVNNFALSRDGKRLASLHWNFKTRPGPDTTQSSVIEVWDVESHRKIWKRTVKGFLVRLVFSPSSTRLVSVGESPGSNSYGAGSLAQPIRLWDVATGQLKDQTTLIGQSPHAQFLPDGSKLVLRTRSGVSLWNVR